MDIQILATIFAGGLAGAFVSYRFNVDHRRTELALEFLEKLEKRIEKIEKAYDILKNDVSEEGVLWEKDENIRKEKTDTIISIGDLLDNMIFLYLTYRLNRSFIEKGHACRMANNFIFLIPEFCM